MRLTDKLPCVARELWQDPKLPLTGLPVGSNEPLTNFTFHYTGALDAYPVWAAAREIAFLQQTQREYTNRKPLGYSIGYNVAIFQSGRTYECRGLDIRCAANGNQTWNKGSFALLVVNGLNQNPSPKMVDAIRAVIGAVGPKLPQKTHDEWRATSCPGVVMRKLVHDGYFKPTPIIQLPELKPEKPPVLIDSSGGKEISMLIIWTESDPRTTFFWNGIQLKWYVSGRTENVLRQDKPTVVEVDTTTLLDLMNDSVCVGTAPFTFGPTLLELWNKRK